MARTMSVAENHHLLWSSSHTARTSRSLKKRIDFLLIVYSNTCRNIACFQGVALRNGLTVSFIILFVYKSNYWNSFYTCTT